MDVETPKVEEQTPAIQVVSSEVSSTSVAEDGSSAALPPQVSAAATIAPAPNGVAGPVSAAPAGAGTLPVNVNVSAAGAPTAAPSAEMKHADALAYLDKVRFLFLLGCLRARGGSWA